MLIDGCVLVADIRARSQRMVRRLGLHHFDHGNEGSLPGMDGEKDFLIVVVGIARPLDQ